MNKTRATLIGFSAVIMWGLLAYLSKSAEAIPPLQLNAMGFFVGGLVGAASWPFRPRSYLVLFGQKWQVWALNVGALFGCHLLYFIAIRNAPAVEVSLIAYTWPLLIVVFSAFAPGEKLKSYHILGVALGVAGAFIVISKGQFNLLSGGLQLGHIIALPYAIMWAGFSVMIRKYGAVPSDIVVGFCFASAALSGIAHFAFEPTLWNLNSSQMFAVLSLGLLPMGLAFYAWDFGMKHGDRMILGVSSYAAPLLSTLVLIGTGFAVYHWSIAVGCLLITAGAILAAKDMIFKKLT
jgi:drug/metabolite transporter (DMT)-like permease